jgi:uncharacterized protein (TIGR02996 family)
MTPEDAFLIDILAHPDEAAPRLVYADWLADQDDPRADWLRRGCAVLTAPALTSERRLLRGKFRRDLYEAGHDWPEVEGVVLTWGGVVSVLRYRLAEVFAWCRGRGLPFRSPRLNPHEGPGWGGDWSLGVQRVALRRGRALAEEGRSPREPAEDLGGGRLLVYLPNVASEEALLASERTEYLDSRHVPGWDTWLAFASEPQINHVVSPADDYLLAWVPPHLVGDVERIKETSPGCLLWAEDHDRPFLQRLRTAGLVG